MNIMLQNQVTDVMDQFSRGEINRQQAIWSILDMPERPDFQGIWEILIVHIALIEISKAIPNATKYINHWSSEIKAWQKRLIRFIQKSKPSFTNAVKKHFYQASDKLFKDDLANLVFSVEIHLEELIDREEHGVADELAKLKIDAKEMEWFLYYETDEHG